ncbi:MAG: DUF1232 domain-containing protein [Thermosynechococcaceae cyanobacterium]
MAHHTPLGNSVGSTNPDSIKSETNPVKNPTPSRRGIEAVRFAERFFASQGSQVSLQNQSNPSGPYQFELLPSFPGTLYEFRKYDGAKALVALILAMAGIYFLLGFFGFLVDHNAWLKAFLFKSSLSDISPQSPWWHFWKPIGVAVTHVASYVDIAFRLFVFICAYCLAWATFDPRNIEGYVMGFFNTCLGVAYLLSPVDAIPDFIPVVGSLDDTFIGLGVSLLGLSSLYRNKLRDIKTKTILELIDDGNSKRALKMLLEDKGITIKDRSANEK